MKFKLGKIKYIENFKKEFEYFDEITKLRIAFSFIMSLLYAPIFPILAQFTYLMNVNVENKIIPAAVVVGFISLIQTFSTRFTKKILDVFSFSNLFKSIIVIDILAAIGFLSYFVSPKLMVFTDSFIDAIAIILGMAYRMAINNYVTYFHNDSYTRMQNIMTKIYADANSIGLIAGIILTAISIKVAVLFFSITIIIVALWATKYIKLFERYDFLYMLHYKRNTKEKK